MIISNGAQATKKLNPKKKKRKKDVIVIDGDAVKMMESIPAKNKIPFKKRKVMKKRKRTSSQNSGAQDVEPKLKKRKISNEKPKRTPMRKILVPFMTKRDDENEMMKYTIEDMIDVVKNCIKGGLCVLTKCGVKTAIRHWLCSEIREGKILRHEQNGQKSYSINLKYRSKDQLEKKLHDFKKLCNFMTTNCFVAVSDSDIEEFKELTELVGQKCKDMSCFRDIFIKAFEMNIYEI